MEYAKLLLELIKVIAWPVTIIIVIRYLRPSIGKIIESFVDARNIELEIGGQKLKVDRFGESVKKTIKEGIELSKNESPEKVESYISENAELLADLSVMEPDEISVLQHISDNPGIHTKGNMKVLAWYGDFKHGYSMVSRVLKSLMEFEFTERTMVKGSYRYQITEKGKKALSLYKSSSQNA